MERWECVQGRFTEISSQSINIEVQVRFSGGGDENCIQNIQCGKIFIKIGLELERLKCIF